MNRLHSTGLIAGIAAAVSALAVSPVLAQRQQADPIQRIDRLEKQVEQVQRQVFPKGRPADTASFSDDPAATQSSVLAISQRIDSLERQMTDLVRINEENANRVRTMERELREFREDERRRLDSLEQKMASGMVPAATVAEPEAESDPAPVRATPPKATLPKASPPASSGSDTTAAAIEEDPGEAAYTEGFKLWEAGQYDSAITSLRAFVSAYPKHRRVSFANNLIGRALLDKGQARAAIPAFLANYRSNPGGERAPDSLYYMGQALMKLGQPAQACNAYSELDEVYGAKIRADLKKLQTEAKQQAQCEN